MASSVPRSDSSRLLAVEILKFPDVLISSIQSVGIERCDPPRGVQVDILHSAVAGFVKRLKCAIPCSGGYVEHILL
ncbi:hypothetical protein TNCV_1510501 [Trichonephila clavipes]|nr:hypothetical protein TNCV_1510501 [Trichonephila clavipes]